MLTVLCSALHGSHGTHSSALCDEADKEPNLTDAFKGLDDGLARVRSDPGGSSGADGVKSEGEATWRVYVCVFVSSCECTV